MCGVNNKEEIRKNKCGIASGTAFFFLQNIDRSEQISYNKIQKTINERFFTQYPVLTDRAAYTIINTGVTIWIRMFRS